MPNKKTPEEQVDRLYKIADQQASAHAVLHSFYHRCHMAISISTLVISTCTLTLSLASDQSVEKILRVPAEEYKWLIAALAAFTSILTLIDLFWRPAEKSKSHQGALKHNSNTKNEIRRLQSSGPEITQPEFIRIQEIHQGFKEEPVISERLFLKLKARHHQKIRISKELDKNSHAPIWFMRVRFTWLDIKKFWSESTST